jgi:hypothetical protein
MKERHPGDDSKQGHQAVGGVLLTGEAAPRVGGRRRLGAADWTCCLVAAKQGGL